MALAAVLASGAVMCPIAVHLIGAGVDRQGVQREPFGRPPIRALPLSRGLAPTGAWRYLRPKCCCLCF